MRQMDEADQQWVAAFQGGDEPTIPTDAIIEGFVSVITYIDPESGKTKWVAYNTVSEDKTRVVGLLTTVIHHTLAMREES